MISPIYLARPVSSFYALLKERRLRLKRNTVHLKDCGRISFATQLGKRHEAQGIAGYSTFDAAKIDLLFLAYDHRFSAARDRRPESATDSARKSGALGAELPSRELS